MSYTIINTQIAQICEHGNLQSLADFFDANGFDEINEALVWASLYGRREMVEYLLEIGADVNYNDSEPLKTVLEEIYVIGHNPNKNDKIKTLIKIGHVLLQRGAQITQCMVETGLIKKMGGVFGL